MATITIRSNRYNGKGKTQVTRDQYTRLLEVADQVANKIYSKKYSDVVGKKQIYLSTPPSVHVSIPKYVPGSHPQFQEVTGKIKAMIKHVNGHLDEKEPMDFLKLKLFIKIAKFANYI